jgi:uncharacterized protein DUF6282
MSDALREGLEARPEGLEVLPEGFAALLEGSVDVHVHGQPDLATALRNRGDDLAVIRMARRYGISGWVLKSHLWITTDRAALLQRQAAGLGFTVYGSITLNPPMGGVSATAVELAAAHGARVVFLPTWGAAADVRRGGYIAGLLGQLSPSFPGYVVRLLITHPLHYTQDPGELRRFAEQGAFVEFAGAPLLHPDSHLSIRDVHAAMSALGPDRVILSTDAFSRWAPPEPECLRMFTEQLAYLGWQPPQLQQMTVGNPRAFLGVAPAVPRGDERSIPPYPPKGEVSP